MSRDWWTPDELTKAARLLQDAASNLHTTYPDSARYPRPSTLPAVKAMIEAAIDCIKAAQPTK